VPGHVHVMNFLMFLKPLLSLFPPGTLPSGPLDPGSRHLFRTFKCWTCRVGSPNGANPPPAFISYPLLISIPFPFTTGLWHTSFFQSSPRTNSAYAASPPFLFTGFTYFRPSRFSPMIVKDLPLLCILSLDPLVFPPPLGRWATT